jgi:bifunctional non-homologous end joining protein LigD
MSDDLSSYWKKRDFSRTAEPQGRPAPRKESPSPDEPGFVIQRHQARHLHYDFRLELDGVLKSWAVPKGPSRDPAVKRLAVAVEDHPLEYGGFQGEIPAGQYGAGTVEIWDAGTWHAEGDAHAMFRSGHLRFTLRGRHLQGEWILLRTGRAGQWLLRKLQDEYTRPDDDADALAPIGRSAVAAHGKGRGRQAPAAKTSKAVPVSRTMKRPVAAGKAVRRAMPRMIEPQLAVLSDEPPEDSGWSYEVKYDGYRMLCRVDGSKAAFFSRTGKDWSARLRPLADAVAALGLGRGWLDGEVVVFVENGRSSFQALQNALDSASTAPRFIAFDLPYWNGYDLRGLPLAERQTRLEKLLGELPAEAPVSFTDRLDVDEADHARAAVTEACRLGLEGLIAKRLDAPYESVRSLSWLKLKCRPRQEFVVAGYTSPAGARTGFGGLLVGVREEGELRYAGRIGTGFNAENLVDIHKRLRALHADGSPFRHDLPAAHKRFPGGRRSIHWVRPELVVEAEFSGWTRDGLVRQASFQGIREDKPAGDVGRETAWTGDRQTMTPTSAKGTDTAASAVACVRITHPDKLLYRDPDIDKLTLARYVETVAPHLLPHVKGRRLAFLRCPDGADGECFFQKHIREELPAGLQHDGEHVLVTGTQGLVWLAQRGVIEIHTWGSSRPRPESPDRITLDLDPGPGVSWTTLVEAAQLTATLVRELGLEPFLKTTGGKGLHIVVPIRRTLDWDTARSFAQAMAGHLAGLMPDRFTANMSKEKRTGRIYVDYLRNGENATAIAAFAMRARRNAPVSMPIGWEELTPDRDLREGAFNILNVPRILEQRRADPWEGYPRAARTVTRAMLEQTGVQIKVR